MDRTIALKNLYHYIQNNKDNIIIPFHLLSVCALAGRVCYTTYPDFDNDKRLNEEIVPYLDKLSKWTHYSVFAHLPVIVEVDTDDFVKYELYNLFKGYYDKKDRYLHINLRHILEAYQTQNKGTLSNILSDFDITDNDISYFRVLLKEAKDLGYIKYDNEGKILVVYIPHLSFLFDYGFYYIANIDRAMSHQIVRHQALNFNQQSQRYVKMKNITIPHIRKMTMENFFKEKNNSLAKELYENTLNLAFDNYQKLLDLKVPSEKARGILPNDTPTNLIISGFNTDIDKFIADRSTKQAQEEIRELARLLNITKKGMVM